MATKTDPHVFVVIGGTGDLMRRKLLPALAHLREQKLLGDRSVVLGASRSGEMNDADYRRWSREALPDASISPERLGDWCDACLHYQPVGQNAVDDYRQLASRIESIEREHGLEGNRTFYLALPPGMFPQVIECLGEAGLHRAPGWSRLVVEKPFGHDLASAQELNGLVHRYFDESQVYRIDHYLGKETVQNLTIFRFANMVFESLWNRDRIDNVQITVGESIGVGTRAGYYDKSGALRDMIQNHVTQLLTLIAMDSPARFEADELRDEKLRVLRAIEPIRAENVVFGQYTAGGIEGRGVAGYREEQDVASDSQTETYVAMKLFIDNWRWKGVPFYLRTGKRLPAKVSEIAMTFREPPVCLFRPLGECALEPNVLRLRLQPDEAFSLSFEVKTPGEPLELKQYPLRFSYADAFGALPDAYTTLLLDIVRGDQTLFLRGDEVEAAWRLYTPLLQRKPAPLGYAAGTWGPAEADRLLDGEGAGWRTS